MNQNSAKSDHHVVAVAYDGLRTFEFGCVVEFFALERPELKTDWYRFSVCSADSRTLRAAGDIDVTVSHGLELLETADTIVIPAWRNVNDIPPPQLLKALYSAWCRGTRICSICSGVFVLAAAGILKGKTVTTHWHHTRLLAQRYPDIIVSNSALYIDEGQIITSAGSAAGLDMLLHLVKRDHGVRIANMVAERLVIPFLRAGEHSQQKKTRIVVKEENRIASLIDWLNQNFCEHQTIADLARRMMMSERTLQRHFIRVTGVPLMRWLTIRRLDYARELLQTTACSIERIAELSGHYSVATLRYQFRLHERCSPSQYRQMNNQNSE